ncbi:hypothetical protein QE152_g8775 [Popillia japonica]|uniref:Uncharacterized protein n=1 Tax=Popillia japonica TaxID=7064 RepID=A0AAW1M0Q1_POPJA
MVLIRNFKSTFSDTLNRLQTKLISNESISVSICPIARFVIRILLLLFFFVTGKILAITADSRASRTLGYPGLVSIQVGESGARARSHAADLVRRTRSDRHCREYPVDKRVPQFPANSHGVED